MGTACEWHLKALTPIWTGRVTRIEERRRDNRTELREVIESDRLVHTGLLGSIRWWFEILVRGLGGSACDPSDTKCKDKQHCAVCELFGCTGWARKFRFQVLAGDSGDTIQSETIAKDPEFRLRFQPLRDIAPEEWALLDCTLRLIAEYGAIGGKTTLKPSDEESRVREKHHQDYGLVALEKRPQLTGVLRRGLEARVRKQTWRQVEHDDFAWASLRNFWCVSGRYLARQNAHASAFNQVIGREEQKSRRQQIRSDGRTVNQWLAGRQGESKKVFSFKNPPRTFGFFKPGTVEFEEVTRRLKKAWPDLKDAEILKGDAILARLLGEEANT